MPTQTINGTSLHYVEKSKGFPVVLVHGFPLDHRIWNHQVESLSTNHRIIAPDLRGFGKSAMGPAFTMNDLADDLHALLSRIGALPCILGGLSMGGYVALAYWKKYAADLRGLILVDTRAQADAPEGKKGRDAMIELARTKGSSAVADQMMPKMLAPTATADVKAELRQIMEACPSQTIQYALAAMRDREDFTAALPAMKQPTLIIVGESDVLTTPAMSELMHKGIGHSEMLVVAGAGHISSMEQPDQLNAAIGSFLAKQLVTS